MRISATRLFYAAIAVVVAGGLTMAAVDHPEPVLSASDVCYGLCSSRTVLSVSPATVSFRHLQDVRFSVTVGGGSGADMPTGKVLVISDMAILCQITLSHGAGSCSPRPRSLPPGVHQVLAYYRGNGDFHPSLSAPVILTVLGGHHHRCRHHRWHRCLGL